MRFYTSRKFYLPLGIICAGLLVTALLIDSRPELSLKEKTEKVWSVSVLKAEPVNIQPKISIFGEVKAAREAQLRAILSGRVSMLSPLFKDGAFLNKGAELIAIERTEYEHQATEKRAELAHAEAVLKELAFEKKFEEKLLNNSEKQVSLARRDFERTSKLAATGRESKRAIDNAESKLAGAEKDKILRDQKVARLEARIKQQSALYKKATASFALAEQALADTVILAPFDGYVADVKIALGQLVSKGEKIGRLLSANDLEVQFELPEGDYGRFTSKSAIESKASNLLMGRSLEIVWKLGSREYRYEAILSRIGPELNSDTGGIDMFASIDERAEKGGLRSGAFVEILFPDFEYQDVVPVPVRAVAEKSYIYVVRESRLVRVPVEVVGKDKDHFLVRSEVVSGELIVSRLFENIGPGLRVKAL